MTSSTTIDRVVASIKDNLPADIHLDHLIKRFREGLA
jgi:hypothetical protein